MSSRHCLPAFGLKAMALILIFLGTAAQQTSFVDKPRFKHRSKVRQWKGIHKDG